MARKPTRSRNEPHPLAHLACPNEDCSAFNRFDADNLSVIEWAGKRKNFRRLYGCHCGHLKCVYHGCSITASADICEVDARTVERVLKQAGPRADDFHRLQVAGEEP